MSRSLKWLSKALTKNTLAKGYKYKVVCPAAGQHGQKTKVTKSIHKKKSAANKVVARLKKQGWWTGCRVTKIR